MMSLWDALRMNMMISYQELVRTFPSAELCCAGVVCPAKYSSIADPISSVLVPSGNVNVFPFAVTFIIPP
ncbi:hypothetical protein, partial [Serratia marcescens]|uniref:hypothetical protein n=1 Tax=Serratia marcescens TaxID=615 RepID=UPI0025AB55A8